MNDTSGIARAAFAALLALAAAGAASAQPAPEWRLPYDIEYPTIDYTAPATANPIARLAERLERGEVRLEHKPGRGYLDSLLAALEIDASSQVLVFSRTSLQASWISPERPRAIYFNDDVYVGWVQGSGQIELTATDAERGAVFYVFPNTADREPVVERRFNDCLLCHDTNALTGGGLPVLLAKSGFIETDGSFLDGEILKETTDQSPLRDRWGGWYVTGRRGSQLHLGNLLVPIGADVETIEPRRDELETLDGAGLFDTSPYLTPTSDIVALLVLEHQLTVQNEITRVKFKAPFVLERSGHGDLIGARTWDEMPPDAQRLLTRMLDSLVDRLLLVNAAPFEDRIAGTSGFDAWFEAQGPRDQAGRSLRELDLGGRLFRYPLSYLVYSAEFGALPAYAKDYAYRRIAAVLDGSDRSESFAHLSADDRAAIQDILLATKPDYARAVEAGATL